jgi:molecular chaperone DnaK
MAKDNKTIGKFHLDGLPPSQRGIPQIEVTFDIDANGIINVSAADKGTNKTQSIRIEAASGLSKEEIDRMKSEAEANAENDQKAKEEAELINKTDSTVFQSERSLKDLEDKITEDQKNELTTLINDLKDSHQKRELSVLEEKMDKLNTKFQEVSQLLYENTQSETTTEKADDFSDVDFEEVK